MAAAPVRAVFFCAVFLPGAVSGQERASDEQLVLPRLTAVLRDRIDRLAGQQKLEETAEQNINFAGNITAWLIHQFPLSADEEFRLAGAAHDDLKRKVKLLAPSGELARILAKLVDTIPTHLKPTPFQFEIYVIDSPRVNVFTSGAGRVYVHKGLVEALLAQKERGSAALAFHIAQELAHISLGHCRIGYQRKAIEDDLKAGIKLNVKRAVVEKILQTTVAPVGMGVTFLYSREQEYAADLFALHLCRNAGTNLDHCLDAVRSLIVLEFPRLLDDPAYVPNLAERSPVLAYLQSKPPALWRLARLHMEIAGTVRGDQFGLFVLDRDKGNFSRARDKAAGAGPVIVFVHGMLGGDNTFAPLLAACRKNPELAEFPILIFRYPNNGSLALAGEFLAKEMARVLTDPRQALFVSHSAGGLVVRYYAERKRGPFNHAIFLGTPHQGSSLRPMKFLVDACDCAGATFKIGLPQTIAKTIPEGKGEIGNDLEPGSLFLRYLGHDAELARRYHLIFGQVIQGPGGLVLKTSLNLLVQQLRPHLLKLAVEQMGPGRYLDNAKTVIGAFMIPDEILDGDLAVSVASARLLGAGADPATNLNHEQLLSNPEVIRRVLELLVSNARTKRTSQ